MKMEPFRLERFFAKYEFSAPYLLSSSDCESFTVQELLDLTPGSEAKFKNQWLGYTESQGNPELRREISVIYDNIHAHEVLVHAGAEEAIYNFMNAVLKPGDHVIIHYPCYQSLEEVPRAIGCEVTRWETSESAGWELDAGFLRKNIRKNTKVIAINCPHNPTGYLMDREKFLEIVKIAQENDILLFSDEVYRLLEYDFGDRLPAACDIYENAVSLGVMSKAFGLAGLRIGWIATRNRDVYSAMASYKDYTSICSSAPSEFLAALALKHKEVILRRNLEIIHNSLSCINDFFARYRHIFSWKQPKAGSIAFPGLKIDTAVEDFCIRLVESKGVLLLPGNYFDPRFNNFRMGFGRKNIPQCIEKLDDFMREYY